MKKLVPMAVVAMCIATAAFASFQHPNATSNHYQTAMVTDTIPGQEDTSAVPQDQNAFPAPADTSATSTDTTGSK